MTEPSPPKSKRQFGCGQVVGLMLVAAILSAGAMFWWAKRYLYAKELSPVALSNQEEQVLERKLTRLEAAAMGNVPKAPIEGQVIETADQDSNAEAYSEEGATREIELSERELNALIAKNDPDTAKHFAVDLSKDLVSLKVIVPVDEDAPFMGGKTIRIKAGLGVGYEEGQARLVLKGISLGGIPLPNAWLGNLKGKDFIEEFGEGGGVWKQFSDGIEYLEVQDGRLKVKLKE